jgi:hypothetical protein
MLLPLVHLKDSNVEFYIQELLCKYGSMFLFGECRGAEVEPFCAARLFQEKSIWERLIAG